MTKMQPVILAIGELLEAERDKILTADFRAMSEISLKKEALFQELAKNHLLDPAILVQISEKSSVNQCLLEASMRGVKAATSRLQLLLHGNKSLKTYDKTGFQHTLGVQKTATIEKRS